MSRLWAATTTSTNSSKPVLQGLRPEVCNTWLWNQAALHGRHRRFSNMSGRACFHDLCRRGSSEGCHPMLPSLPSQPAMCLLNGAGSTHPESFAHSPESSAPASAHPRGAGLCKQGVILSSELFGKQTCCQEPADMLHRGTSEAPESRVCSDLVMRVGIAALALWRETFCCPGPHQGTALDREGESCSSEAHPAHSNPHGDTG